MPEDPKEPAVIDPKPTDPAPDPKVEPEKGSKYNASNTAHAIARQPKDVIEETLGILAIKHPEMFALIEDPAPDPAKPTPPDPNPDANGESQKLTAIEAEIQTLKEENWTKTAMLRHGLTEEDARFITGSSEKEIQTSALAFKESMLGRVKTALEEAGADPADPPKDTPKPTPVVEKDDPIPQYKGASVKIDAEQAEKDFLECDIPKWGITSK